MDPSSRWSGFGKRGRVEIPSRPAEPPRGPERGTRTADLAKWAAGGIAAVFLIGAMTGGTGGGGLIGGILGGLLGHHLAKNAAAKAASSSASAPHAKAPGSVQRGGFGSTGGSGGFSFGG